MLSAVVHWLAASTTSAASTRASSTDDTCLSGKTFCFNAQSWTSALLHIAVIVVLAIVIRYLSHRIITRVVRRTANGLPLPLRRLRGKARELLEVTDELPLVNERREQRAQAVGSVLKSIATAFIFGTAAVMVLKELGLDIAPVLTSAGIVGVAVGFGAQNLVRDFLSGIFMILEDQFGVGDVIDAGPASGVVEAVGLRTTRLRAVDGAVWHVRNGEIARVGNMSQNWSRAVIDVAVDYRTDLARASEVIQAAADAVYADPTWTTSILEEPQVWGVERFDDSAVVVRLVVKTKPLKQWDVARAVRARIKADFDDAGIPIPLPQRTVWMHDPAGGQAAPAAVGAGGARVAGSRGPGPDGELRP